MNFKSKNQLHYNESERFKLYKSGKLWLVAGLTFFSLAGGALVNTTNVHADVTGTEKTDATSTSATSAASASTTSAAETSSTSASATSSTTASSASTSAATSSSTTSATSESTKSASTSSATSAESTSTTSASSSSAAKSTTASTAASSVKTSAAASSAATTSAVAESTSVASSSAATTKTTTAKALAATASTVAKSSQGTDIWTIGDTSRPTVDAVDVSSYQSAMTQSDYDTLAAAGVKTIIVKATEGSTYTNPYAVSQAQMANNAGLNVDFYHYADFATTSAAQSEASNLVNFLQTNNVSKNVLLFADMEDSSTYSVNAAANLNAFWSTLDAAGYTNHGVYTSNSYEYRDAVVSTVGQSRTWRAQYPYTPSANDLWNTGDGAWQFSSTALLPAGSTYTGYLDVSVDYTGLLEDSAGTNTFSQTSSNGDTLTNNNTTTNNGSTSTPTVTAQSGVYFFSSTTPVKASASTSAATLATYYSGDSVIYNAVVTTGNQTWLRYTGSNGQHYVQVNNLTNLYTRTVKAGTYKFTKTTAIKNSAQTSAATIGTYASGDTVNYVAKLTNGNQTWLEYTSYSGASHYVQIPTTTSSNNTGSSTTNTSSKETIQSVSGTYKFTKTTAIRSAVSDSASQVGTYYKGDTVSYNAKITKNGETWLRYLSYSGAQHYVKISSSTTSGSTNSGSTSTNNSSSQETIKTVSGAYKFTTNTAIKTAASDSSTTVGSYDKGDTVYYNAQITKGGETWLRYLSYSGTQHYVKVSGTSSNSSTSSSNSSSSTAQSGTYTFGVTTNIRTAASLNAAIVGTYDAGESVYYVGTVQADGYKWLKYLSNSGSYRYVAMIG